MESNIAALVLSLALGDSDLDLRGTSALGVLHGCSIFLARLLLLARRSIRHLVVKLQIDIEFN